MTGRLTFETSRELKEGTSLAPPMPEGFRRAIRNELTGTAQTWEDAVWAQTG